MPSFGEAVKREMLVVAAAIAALWLMLLVAVVLVARPSLEPEVVVEERNLEPARQVGFAPGESYRYLLVSEGSEIAVNISVTEGSTNGTPCLLVLRDENASGGARRLGACYSRLNGSVLRMFTTDGAVESELPPNFYAGDPVMVFYEPWMLAAEENWSGSLSVTARPKQGDVRLIQLGQTVVTEYVFVGRERVMGRDALVVNITVSRLAGNETMPVARRIVWVDEDRRVLLRELDETGGARAEKILVSAPFPLEKD